MIFYRWKLLLVGVSTFHVCFSTHYYYLSHNLSGTWIGILQRPKTSGTSGVSATQIIHSSRQTILIMKEYGDGDLTLIRSS